MDIQPNAYTALYLTATVVSLVAAYFAWQRRSARGGRWLFILMLAMAQWSFADALDLSATTQQVHLMWAKISYFGATTVAVWMLLFALEYTGRGRWARPGVVAGLLVLPAFSIVAAFTNDLHRLVWPWIEPASGDPRILVYGHGPLWWPITIYSFVLLLVLTTMFIEFSFRTRRLYRFQSVALIIAVLIPWAAMIVYTFAPDLLPGVNPSVGLVASGAIFTFSMLRYRLLDLAPVARGVLVERMADGVLVLDAEHRVADLNPAVRELFRVGDAPVMGERAVDALSGWPEAAHRLRSPSAEQDEFTLLSPGGRSITFEVSGLTDAAGEHGGTLIGMHDVSARVRAEMALKQANEDLVARLAEIEALHEELSDRAIRDPLTGLFNRRYLAEALSRELARAEREDYPVSLVMIDVDCFKLVNDENGHAAGDLVLQILARQLDAQTRAGDIVCRYGGDEFLLALTDTGAEVALQRAEEWRVDFRASSISLMGLSAPATISIGVATFPLHGDTVDKAVAAADDALYAAKAAGRDRVIVHSV